MYNDKCKGTTKLGDAYALDIVEIGRTTLAFENGVKFVLQNIRHVPKIAKSMTSIGHLDNLSYHTLFDNWIKNQNLVVFKGLKHECIYSMYVSSVRYNDFASYCLLSCGIVDKAIRVKTK